jgi:hypothetical protein
VIVAPNSSCSERAFQPRQANAAALFKIKPVWRSGTERSQTLRWREPDFEPSVPRESNGEKAKELVSLVERKVPEMSSTGRRLSIFTSGFSRD